MKWVPLGEAQWDVHSKVFHVDSNNLLLISATSGFLCVSEHTMASVLLLFFPPIHRTVGFQFWAAAASAQAVIKMFSQRLFCSRFQHSVEPKKQEACEKYRAPSSGPNSDDYSTSELNQIDQEHTKRTIRNFRRLMRRHACVDTLKAWLSSSHSVWLKACWGFLLLKKCTNWPEVAEDTERGAKWKKKWSVCVKRTDRGEARRKIFSLLATGKSTFQFSAVKAVSSWKPCRCASLIRKHVQWICAAVFPVQVHLHDVFV